MNFLMNQSVSHYLGRYQTESTADFICSKGSFSNAFNYLSSKENTLQNTEDKEIIEVLTGFGHHKRQTSLTR
jgi:cation transport regulator ChaC